MYSQTQTHQFVLAREQSYLACQYAQILDVHGLDSMRSVDFFFQAVNERPISVPFLRYIHDNWHIAVEAYKEPIPKCQTEMLEEYLNLAYTEGVFAPIVREYEKQVNKEEERLKGYVHTAKIYAVKKTIEGIYPPREESKLLSLQSR